MRKSLFVASLVFMTTSTTVAEVINLAGKDYEFERLIDRKIGPGVTYTRMRFPDYPLNVNMLTVDLNNQYNRIETTAGKETSYSTESLVTAAQRQSSEGHRVLGGANANFWYVGASADGCNEWIGTPRNVSVRNGKMVTESNNHYDSWNGGPGRHGAVAISEDKVAHVDYVEAPMTITNEKIGTAPFHQCNKGVFADEIGIYNSFYGSDRRFLPCAMDPAGGLKRVRSDAPDCTEVLLDIDEGERWMGGEDIVFTVKEVRTNTCGGTLGAHDLAIVGRVNNPTKLDQLVAGDKVTLNYSWIFGPGTEGAVEVGVEQAVGGNAIVMRNGELTDHNTNESYNSMVYSRTGYGCSADGKTLYMIVIDKSTDPVYGSSAGCSTTVMCNIAQYFGCAYMSSMDAGGSAEMMINDQIVNKTTETTPRAVANGWFVYSIAPETERVVSGLEFYDCVLEQPIYARATPQVIAYDQYGAVMDYNYQDVTFSCDPAIGTCDGNVFEAGDEAAVGMLTATCGDVSVSKEMSVVGSEVKIRLANILIDARREYALEVHAENGGRIFAYDPKVLDWTVDDTSVATIDENGVLRGISNGTTKISGTIGRFTTEATVTVEIPFSSDIMLAEYSMWSVKGSSGITNVVMAEDGATSFTYGKPRSPHLEYTNDGDFYSLPDELYCEFNMPIEGKNVQLTVNRADGESTHINIEPESGFEANKDYRLEFDLKSNINTDDMGVFPLSIEALRFTFVANATANKGDHIFKFGGLYAHYDSFDSVEDVRISDELIAKNNGLRLMPNPVDAGSQFTVCEQGVTAVDIYSISGSLVSTVEVGQFASAIIDAPTTAGTYVVHARSAVGNKASILIVK